MKFSVNPTMCVWISIVVCIFTASGSYGDISSTGITELSVPVCPGDSVVINPMGTFDLATCSEKTKDECESGIGGNTGVICKPSSSAPTNDGVGETFCQWQEPPNPNPHGYSGFCYPLCGYFMRIGNSQNPTVTSCSSEWVGTTCMIGTIGNNNNGCPPTKCIILQAQTISCSSDDWYYFASVCIPYFKAAGHSTNSCVEETTTTTAPPTYAEVDTLERLESHSDRRKVWRGIAIGFIVLSGILVVGIILDCSGTVKIIPRKASVFGYSRTAVFENSM